MIAVRILLVIELAIMLFGFGAAYIVKYRRDYVLVFMDELPVDLIGLASLMLFVLTLVSVAIWKVIT